MTRQTAPCIAVALIFGCSASPDTVRAAPSAPMTCDTTHTAKLKVGETRGLPMSVCHSRTYEVVPQGVVDVQLTSSGCGVAIARRTGVAELRVHSPDGEWCFDVH